MLTIGVLRPTAIRVATPIPLTSSSTLRPRWAKAARRLGQLPTHSRAFWRPRHAPTFRTPAGSAAARACAKTPKSRIAFPLEARIARLQSTLAPLPCQSAQAPRDRSPPARLLTQSGRLLGSARFDTPGADHGYRPTKMRRKPIVSTMPWVRIGNHRFFFPARYNPPRTNPKTRLLTTPVAPW